MNKDVIARLDNIEEILKMLLVNSVYESEKDKLQNYKKIFLLELEKLVNLMG